MLSPLLAARPISSLSGSPLTVTDFPTPKGSSLVPAGSVVAGGSGVFGGVVAARSGEQREDQQKE